MSETCKISPFRIFATWQFIPIWMKRELEEFLDTCVVVGSNSLEFAAYKESKIIAASWETWSSELHFTQRLRMLGRYLEIDDSSWELLRGTSKGTWDDMIVDVWKWDGRLFGGDIQDLMIDGNPSHENPSWPHKEMYPMLFDLTTEKGTLFIEVLFASRVVNDSICSMSSSNLSIFIQPERMRVFKDFNL